MRCAVGINDHFMRSIVSKQDTLPHFVRVLGSFDARDLNHSSSMPSPTKLNTTQALLTSARPVDAPLAANCAVPVLELLSPVEVAYVEPESVLVANESDEKL